jgi:hypothetical protein
MRRVLGILGVVFLVGACAGASVPPAATHTTPSATSIPVETVQPSAVPGSSPTPHASVTQPPAPTAKASEAQERTGNTWVKAGSFNEARTVTQLALVETGEVLAVGADIACGLESGVSDTTELWSPATGQWRAGPPMPSGRHGDAAVAVLDDRVLVTGGSNQEYVAKSSTVLYDPEAKTWSRSGLLNTARIDPAITVISARRVLVAGGLLITFSQTGGALDTAEIWDPGTGAWARIAKLSGPRYGAKAVTLDDGRALVVGGLPAWGADNQRRSAELYDPTTGEWESAGELAGTPARISLVATSGGALAIYVTNEGTAPAWRAEWFDPDAAAWSSAGDPGMRVGEGRAAAVTLRDESVLVVAGDEVRVFDLGRSNRWTSVPSIPDGPRNDASAVLLPDGSVLVAGGWTIGPPPDEVGGCESPNEQAWRYIPAYDDSE